MAVANGVVSVTSGAAAKICTMGESGAYVQNLGTGVITLGGPGVTAGKGPALAAAGSAGDRVIVPGARSIPSMAVPSGADQTCDLYAISASTTSNVVFLAPQGG